MAFPLKYSIIFSVVLGVTANLQAAPGQGGHRIRYELGEPGQVSLSIYDNQGRVLRELKRGEPQEAGEHTLVWDGLDRHGNPMPPGDYQWRLLRNEGLQAEYLLSFGINPASAPYHMWVGNHSGPTSVHVDADGNLYATSFAAENAPAVLRQSLDGSRLDWWKYSNQIREGNPEGGMALATDSHGSLYLLQKNGLVQVVDAASGELLRKRINSRSSPSVLNRATRKWDVLPNGIGSGADIAARGDTVVSCGRERGDVRWHKLEDGGVEHSVKVPDPSSLDLAPDETVYVVSGDRIVAVRREGTQETVVAGLSNPGRIAYDETNDQLLVVHGKPRPNQVSRYALDGKLVQTYGKPGGRGFGPYEPLDYYNIIDLAADRRGGFLVVESGDETFRRTARFDAFGKLVKEWHGGQQWGAFLAFDPDDPSRVMFTCGTGIKAFAVADYKARIYRVTHLLRAPDTGGLLPSLTGAGTLWHLRRVGGELYLVNPGGHIASSAPVVYRPDLESGLAVPVARAGKVNPSQIWDFKKNTVKEDAPDFWIEGMKRLGVEVDRRMVLGGAWSGYSWSDANGNGEVDADEIEFGPALDYRSLMIDSNWNLLLAGSLTNSRSAFVHTLPDCNSGSMPPCWKWADAKPTAHRPPPEWDGQQRGTSRAVYRGANGSLYVLAVGRTDDKQGETWPACNLGTARLVKWNAEGELQWNISKHTSTHEFQPGRFHEPMRILGEVHGNLVVQDRVFGLAQVFTPDGLYAGDFFDRRVDDGFPPEIYAASTWAYRPGLLLHDNICGVMEVTSKGEVLWNPAGRTGAPVYRIHGWENWERLEGKVRIGKIPKAAAREGRGLAGVYFSNREWKGEPILSHIDADLWFGKRTLSATRDLNWREWKFEAKPGELSARWEGGIEAPFCEAFTFIVESEYGSHVRLWLDGKLVIAEQAMPLHKGRRAPHHEGRTMRTKSGPIPLEPSRHYDLRVDYASGGANAQMHLMWESDSQERQHVPTEYLYPERTQSRQKPNP